MESNKSDKSYSQTGFVEQRDISLFKSEKGKQRKWLLIKINFQFRSVFFVVKEPLFFYENWALKFITYVLIVFTIRRDKVRLKYIINLLRL